MEFPFSDMKLTSETYFFFLLEQLQFVFLAMVIVELEPQFPITARVFLALMIADCVNYILTYSSFHVYSITFNHIKILLFGTSLLYERHGRSN